MKGGAEMAVPPLFTCPISLDLFRDPVTLCTGLTYDRYHIEKWLASGNLTCPVTMQRLDDLSMVPNRTLRHLIDQWLQSSTQNQQECVELTDADPYFDSMKQVIESDESTLNSRLQVLEKIESLFQEQPFSNSCLISLNFFGLLFELALRNAKTLNIQERLVLVEKSLICALKLMSSSEVEGLNMLKKESNFEGFIHLFEQGSSCIKKSLCLVVEAISSTPETRVLCEKIGKSTKISKGIVHLIHYKSDEVEAGIKAMSALSNLEPNRGNLVREGAIQALISYISNLDKHEKNLASITMSTIERLLSVDTAKEVVLNHPSGVESLVKMVFRVSNHEGSESAVNSLLIICCESRVGREKAIVNGVLTQLLLLLQSQCSGRTKTKARMLLKLFRSMWSEDSSHLL
ncbi:U-box domain-containing protein 26-like [Primulina huaijiensis]|uniref:U-box domain-containing protein 26-like n=1 Tax=Primulina huaijiensis TaxID=1492673 RepID=UPI003CC75B68